MKSEFGKGFIYNLILFAKHWWRLQVDLKTWEKMRKESPDLFTEEDCISLWFNGVGDHFYELEVPPQWQKTRIGKLATRLQAKALAWRMDEIGGRKEFDKFFDDLELLARLIDRELGVKPVKANWS